MKRRKKFQKIKRFTFLGWVYLLIATQIVTIITLTITIILDLFYT